MAPPLRRIGLEEMEPTERELAALVGISERYWAELRAKNIVPRAHRALGPVLRAYIAHVRGTAGTGGERERLLREQADAQAMRNARMRGELLPRADVIAAVQTCYAAVRARLRAIPSALAPQLAGQPHAAPVVEARIAAEIDAALQELAEVRTIADVESAGDDGGGDGSVLADAGAAAAPDGEPVGGQISLPAPRRQRRARPVAVRAC